MVLKSKLVFIYDHNLLTILPGDNVIPTPGIEKLLREDKRIKEFVKDGLLMFLTDAEIVPEVKKEIPVRELNIVPKLPEYKPAPKTKEESF